jgi:hypothetical protein
MSFIGAVVIVTYEHVHVMCVSDDVTLNFLSRK